MHITVAEALQRLRREAPDRETIYYIYIVDRRRQLVGFVSLKDLILANPGRTIGAVMRTDVISCTVDMPVGEVAQIFGEFDLLALPVLDADRQLVGIITYDDALDIQEEEATDDVHRLGAVGPLRGEYLATPLQRVIRSRLVWLTMLFLAELLTGGVLYHYQQLTTMFVILTIFMPVITATGGNSGSQAASLVTRAVALGEIELSDWRRIAWREILSGLVLGACVGLLGGITAMFIYREKAVIAAILLTSLVAVTTAGSLTGSLLPLVFKRFGMDPAISSGPFVASMVDVLGLALYLTIAHYVLLIF